jgi:type I restriction enzyme S subunit
MEKKKKPAIRFKGFTDSWEQRKLGDVASSFEYGLNAAAKAYDGEYKYIRITDIDDNTHEFLTDNLTSPDIDLIGADNYKLTEGDILFARTGASVGKSYIYRNSDGLVYYAGFLIRARINEEYDEEFVFQNTLTDRYNKYIAVTSQRSGQPGVNAQEYAEFEINVPKKEEQTKIGTYFRNLDYLITLHQRKYDKLQIIKKSMLEKMFPQNGSCFPEIRFKGFTDSWEQRKLGELAEIVGGGTPSTSVESYWDGDIDWYAPAEIGEQIYLKSSQRKITEEGLNKSSAKVLPVGTVLFTSRAGIGKTAILLKEGCTNQGFQSIVPNKDKLDSYFIFTRSEELKRYGETVGAGSTFVEVSGKQMANMELMMPTIMDEQQKIGEYFSNLDHLITLHQREVEKLQNIKKSMLETMFV